MENLAYLTKKTLDGITIYLRSTAHDYYSSFDRGRHSVGFAGGYGDDVIFVPQTSLANPPPQYITATRATEADEWTPTALTETEAKALALAPQKDLVHSALVLEDDSIHCLRGLYEAFKADIDIRSDDYADANGQSQALAKFQAQRTALVLPHQCLLRAERALTLAGSMLEHFGAVETTATQVEFLAKMRARPLAAFAIEEGQANAEKAAIADPAYSDLFPPNASDIAKLDVIKKDPARLKKLETAYFSEEDKVEQVWVAPDGLMSKAEFADTAKLWDTDFAWTTAALREVAATLTAKE